MIPSGRATSWRTFKEDFNLNFGDPDEKRTAQSQISNLKQTVGTDVYTAEFRRLVNILEWSEDETLMYLYRKGLKEHVKDMMIGYPEPMTFDKMSALAIKLDNCHWQRQQEKRTQPAPTTNTQPRAPNPFVPRPNNPPQANHRPSNNPPRVQNNTNPFRPNQGPLILQRLNNAAANPFPRNTAPGPRDPNAMDLSATRPRISQEERQRRLVNNLSTVDKVGIVPAIIKSGL